MPEECAARHWLAAGAVVLVLLAGCAASPSGLAASGTVEDNLTTVAVPTFDAPAVNLDAGFTENTGEYDPVTGRTDPQSSSVGSTYQVGATVRIASVKVTQGDAVTAGQTLATLDTAALDAQLGAAKADAEVSAASVDLIQDAIDTTHDEEADVNEAKQKALDAIQELHSTRTKLLASKKKIQKNLPKLKAALTQVEAAIAALPPEVPVPPELTEKQAELSTGIAKTTAGLKQIDKALPKIDKALKKAKQGVKKLNDASAKIADARGTLRDEKEVLVIAAETMKVPIDVVRAQRALATLTSPVNGVVVSAAAAGDQLAPGATVVSIRQTGPSKVRAWLAPNQLDQVCPGDAASIAGDWTTATTPATLTRIGTSAQYPPTSVATDEVHLTRAVEVVLTANAQLPAGVPVDITIHGCHQAAGQHTTNG